MLETYDDLQIICFCIRWSIIRDIMHCRFCNGLCTLKKSKDNCDGYNWRCLTYSCPKYQTTISIKRYTHFEGIQISLRKILKILMHLSNKLKLVEIKNYVGISSAALQKIKNLFVKRIQNYFNENTISLGGPGAIVQIDECMINHTVKNHRGRSPREKTWCLCIVDTSFVPSRGFACVLLNRKKETILPIINSVVRAGSLIHTDEFKSYHELRNNRNYEHATVCHKYNFVAPITGVHTQNVESFNNKLKLFIKEKRGVWTNKRTDLINEFLWYEYKGRNCFQDIIGLFKIE
ncbi:hypothetical protein DMUE_6057 [Dictyocoela muelleri]|nr:hypothetical protein DMUE_6057 [Dictyocoela muelleri]